MRLPRKSSDETICPNISCGKVVVKTKPRFIDNPPTEVVRYSHMEGKTLIGRIYFHSDGTLCSESLVRIEKLSRPTYLRLGDPTVDPRN